MGATSSKARLGLQANEERNKWTNGFFIRSDNVFALFRSRHFEGEADLVSFETSPLRRRGSNFGIEEQQELRSNRSQGATGVEEQQETRSNRRRGATGVEEQRVGAEELKGSDIAPLVQHNQGNRRAEDKD